MRIRFASLELRKCRDGYALRWHLLRQRRHLGSILDAARIGSGRPAPAASMDAKTLMQFNSIDAYGTSATKRRGI